MVEIREKERDCISKTCSARVADIKRLFKHLNISVALKCHYLESFYVNLA